MSVSAPTATSARTAWIRSKVAPQSGKLIAPPAITGFSLQACATPTGWTGSPKPENSGLPSAERDEIGSDLVPDYITSVKDGGFYGWPYSYYGQHADVRVNPQNPELVAKAIAPDYAVGPHTASLDCRLYRRKQTPPTLLKALL